VLLGKNAKTLGGGNVGGGGGGGGGNDGCTQQNSL